MFHGFAFCIVMTLMLEVPAAWLLICLLPVSPNFYGTSAVFKDLNHTFDSLVGRRDLIEISVI